MLLEDVSEATNHDSVLQGSADWTRSSDLVLLIGSTLETETGLLPRHQELVTEVDPDFCFITKIIR